MPTNLENYIKMNRNQFETLSPSDALWAKIDVSIAKPITVASKLSWLKYFGFGASVIAVVVYLKVNSSGKQDLVATVYKQESVVAPLTTNEASPISLNEQTVTDAPQKNTLANVPLV